MLPAEILDRIFSFLQNDRAALTSCSAAHPYLYSLVERYLFVHLFIYIEGIHARHPSAIYGIPVSRLSRCLSERPNLANHVRSVTIDGRIYSRSSNKAFQELSTILPSIQRAESVSLRNIQWLRLPESFRSALLDCLQTPHMEEIHLRDGTDFPLTLLDDCRNIKCLKLDSSDCSYVDYAENETPTSLESLFLGEVINREEFMYWAETRLEKLISLYVKTTLFPLPDLSPIFPSLESLRSLTFAISTSCTSLRVILDQYSLSVVRTVYSNNGRGLPTVTNPSSDFPFDLSALVCLEVVTVHANIEGCIYPIEETGEPLRYGHWCKSSFPVIAGLVSTAGSSLERVVLDLSCAVDGASDLCYAVEWEPLILLCDSLPHLRVDLCIWASDSQGQLPVVEMVDSLSANDDLSRLMERGSLTVEPPLPQLDF